MHAETGCAYREACSHFSASLNDQGLTSFDGASWIAPDRFILESVPASNNMEVSSLKFNYQHCILSSRCRLQSAAACRIISWLMPAFCGSHCRAICFSENRPLPVWAHKASLLRNAVTHAIDWRHPGSWSRVFRRLWCF